MYSTGVCDWFRDAAEVAAAYKRLPDRSDPSPGWAKGTLDDARRHATTGALELVKRTWPRFERLSNIPTPRPVWVPAVCGAFPVVPQAIIGDPAAMRTRVNDARDSHPVRIFLEVAVSAGIKAHTIEARGAAVVALANRLGELRPVELWGHFGMSGTSGKPAFSVLWKVGHAPLNLAASLGALASAPFVRWIAYNAGEQRQRHCLWRPPWDSEAGIREQVGAGPSDLVFPGGHLNDPLTNEPENFIERTIERFAKHEELLP
jgi:hypothetical protein